MIRITPFNVITFIMMVATAGVIWMRYRKTVENNWPLFYYLGIVVYLKAFDGSLEPLAVYVGMVAALFLRFEFLGGFILKSVKVVDLLILGYFLWRGGSMILMM
jgi:hypothetical protein